MSAMFPEARRVLDLFSGAVGGWTYACRWAGLEVVAACEVDPWRREVYAAVHHSAHGGGA
jgi:site-specific DNA-cytosine methylase